MAQRAPSEDDPAFKAKVRSIVVASDMKEARADDTSSRAAGSDDWPLLRVSPLTYIPTAASLINVCDSDEVDQTTSVQHVRPSKRRKVLEPFRIPSEKDVKRGSMTKAVIARKQYSVGCDILRWGDFEGAIKLRDFAAERWDEVTDEVKRVKGTRITTYSLCKNLRDEIEAHRQQNISLRSQVTALSKSRKNEVSAVTTHWQEHMDEATEQHDADLDEARNEVAARDAKIRDLEIAAKRSVEQVAAAKGQTKRLETALAASKSLTAEKEKVVQELRDEITSLKSELVEMTEKVKSQKEIFDIERESLVIRIKALKGGSGPDADNEDDKLAQIHHPPA